MVACYKMHPQKKCLRLIRNKWKKRAFLYRRSSLDILLESICMLVSFRPHKNKIILTSMKQSYSLKILHINENPGPFYNRFIWQFRKGLSFLSLEKIEPENRLYLS